MGTEPKKEDRRITGSLCCAAEKPTQHCKPTTLKGKLKNYLNLRTSEEVIARDHPQRALRQLCVHSRCVHMHYASGTTHKMETSASRQKAALAHGLLTLCLQQVLHHLLQADQVDEFVVGSAGQEVHLRGRGLGWGDFKQCLLQLFAQCKLGSRLPTGWRIRSGDHGGHAGGGGVGLSRGGCSFQRCWGGLWGDNDLVSVLEGHTLRRTPQSVPLATLRPYQN